MSGKITNSANSGVWIRRGVRADAGQIADIHVRVWQIAYRGLLPAILLDNLSIERRFNYWEQTLSQRDGGQVVFVAEEVDGLVGFASMGAGRDPDSKGKLAELFTLYLLPSKWGSGVGYSLFEAVVKEARSAGFGEITLWVLHDNKRAIKFYERVGFQRDPAPGGVKIEQAGETVLREVRYRLVL